MTKECFIFDLDGTLANGAHRIHRITTEGKSKDWSSYFAALIDDELILPISRLAHALALCYDIVYVSGRPEEYQDETLEWMQIHALPNGALYMRKEGDYRDDNIIKIELLAELRADGYEPIMAFDDRARVVRAWREAGICCAQVADGDL